MFCARSRLEAEPLAPRLDLGGNFAFGVRPETAFRDLLSQALHKELRAARVVQQRKSEINGISDTETVRSRAGGPEPELNSKHSPPRDVVLIRHVLPASLREVDDTLDVVLVEHLAQLALVRLGEEDALRGHVRNVVQELLDHRRGAVELETEVDERLRNRLHLGLGNVTADEDTSAGTGLFEASRTEKGSPVRFLDVPAEARDLASARHFCTHTLR